MIIAFSGTDGAGKSTQIAQLTSTLQAAGQRTKYMWARGGYTPVLLALKSIVLRLFGRRGGTKGFDADRSVGYSERRGALLRRPVVARLWLTLAIVDMILLYGVYLRMLSALGRVVICDRYVADTEIDFERNFGQQFRPNGPLWRLLVLLAPRPDIHILLTVPVEISLERSRSKKEPFPEDAETLAFRLKRYRTAPAFAAPEVIVLDGTAGIESLALDIRAAIGARRPEVFKR